MVKKPAAEPERIAIPMSAGLIARIDEYRWNQRIASRAAAIRALLEDALRRHEERGKAKGRPPAADR